MLLQLVVESASLHSPADLAAHGRTRALALEKTPQNLPSRSPSSGLATKKDGQRFSRLALEPELRLRFAKPSDESKTSPSWLQEVLAAVAK